jgi:hypothetical protein
MSSQRINYSKDLRSRYSGEIWNARLQNLQESSCCCKKRSEKPSIFYLELSRGEVQKKLFIYGRCDASWAVRTRFSQLLVLLPEV